MRPRKVAARLYTIRCGESAACSTAQIWDWRGSISRCRLAAITGISISSCASENELIAVRWSIDGSSRCPPLEQFSITSCGSRARMRSKNA